MYQDDNISLVADSLLVTTASLSLSLSHLNQMIETEDKMLDKVGNLGGGSRILTPHGVKKLKLLLLGGPNLRTLYDQSRWTSHR